MANNNSILNNPVFATEERAREYLESVRWPMAPLAPIVGRLRTGHG